MAFLSLLIGWFGIPAAKAADIQGVIDSVGGMLPSASSFVSESSGANVGGLNGIMITVVEQIRPIFAVIALLLIVVMGFRMVISQEDEVREKAKTFIIECVTGLILAYLCSPFINAFYGTSGEVPRGDVAGGASILSDTVMVIINWSLGLVAVLAMFSIIASSLQALMKSGSEEGTASLRRTVFTVVSGIVIIVIREVLVLTMGLTPNAAVLPGQADSYRLASTLIGFVDFILAWATLIAVAIVIYAGIRIILSFGKQEQVTKARDLIFRALIGLVIIGVSFALVHFVVSAIA